MQAIRKIIKIEEEKCTGCGLCIPNCPEGALQIIEGKVRLISDLFCDGLGACIGHCPEGAITVEEREAQEYDERKVMGNIVRQGSNVIKAHLEHLKTHNQSEYLAEAIDFLEERNIEVPLERAPVPGGHERDSAFFGCPGSRTMEVSKTEEPTEEGKPVSRGASQLRQWPVQIMLVPPTAPYLKDADVLIAADCVPYAYADFHEDLLKGKSLLVGCPKLDDIEFYREKIAQILKGNPIKSITYAHMEVPCCSGLVPVVRSAIAASGKDIPFKEVAISIRGQKL